MKVLKNRLFAFIWILIGAFAGFVIGGMPGVITFLVLRNFNDNQGGEFFLKAIFVLFGLLQIATVVVSAHWFKLLFCEGFLWGYQSDNNQRCQADKKLEYGKEDLSATNTSRISKTRNKCLVTIWMIIGAIGGLWLGALPVGIAFQVLHHYSQSPNPFFALIALIIVVTAALGATWFKHLFYKGMLWGYKK
jgi:hypothetical protein